MDRVSPLTVRIMLACYCTTEPQQFFPNGSWDSSAAREAKAWLKVWYLVDDQLNVTEKGNAWVDGICAVPLPVQEWKIPARAAA